MAKVDVALVPVNWRYGVESPEAIVLVALERMVVVAVPFCEMERTVVDALPSDVSPETESAESVPTEVKDDAVTVLPKVLFERTFVPLI